MLARKGIVAVALSAVVLVAGGAALAFSVTRDRGDDAAADDVDIAVVGDSFAEQSEVQLRSLAEAEGLTTEFHVFGGTALCAWWDRLEGLLERDPQVLVLSFAGNALQECINPNLGEPTDPLEVAAGYREDLDEVLELYEPLDTDIYVVMPPPIGVEQFETNAAAMRDMYRAAGQDHPHLGIIDSTPSLDPDGTGFQPTLPCEPWDDCEPDQARVTVREDDRIHLTPAGGERYARAIFSALGYDS